MMDNITRKTLHKIHEPTLHDVPSGVLDCRRAKNALRWEATTPLETGLRQLSPRLKARNQLT